MTRGTYKNANPLLLFIFQPFVGFLVSLKDFTSNQSRTIFVAFSTLWGYAQSFSYTLADVYRLGAAFCRNPIYEFQSVVGMFADGEAIDGYLLVVNFIVHQFSNNAKIYFAVLGFLYGIFCYEVLASLAKERSGEKCANLSHILFLCFVTSSLANMAMPRYWTAAWISALVFLKIT